MHISITPTPHELGKAAGTAAPTLIREAIKIMGSFLFAPGNARRRYVAALSGRLYVYR